MNQKTLIGLAIAALVAIVAAVVLNHANKPSSEGRSDTSNWLAPSLRDHVNDVSKVVVIGAGDKTLATLVRGAKGWTLAEKGGYAIDTGKLREFLLKLGDAKLVERKTVIPEKYATLGVEDVSAKEAKGLQVELDGLAQPLKLILGMTNPRGGTFVRRVGDVQSWLASGTLSVEKNAADWLKKDLVDISADRVASIAITHSDGKTVRITKDARGDANFKLADIPKGRETGSEYTINALAATLAGLRFDDVLPAKDAAPAADTLKAHYATFDGVIVDMVAWQKDGKDEVQFTASLDAEQADKGVIAAQAKAKTEFESATAAAAANKQAGATEAPIKPLAISDAAKDHENRMAALSKEVADLNARFSGWTYVLPAYKFASINKSIDDLLKPLEDKKPAASAKSPAPKRGK
ncbi:MAG: DUF4340 domain-containing protein [Dokdonella sp.]